MFDVFGNILDPELENDMYLYKENLIVAMQTHSLIMTPKVHLLVHHVPKYVRRTGVPLGPTSEQAPESQHTIVDIFNGRLEVNFTENVYLMLYYVVTFFKYLTDVLYIVFSMLTASDSWVWVTRQEVYHNANYTARRAHRRTACIVHSNCQPRFF